MYAKVSIYFRVDLAKTPFVPYYIFRTNNTEGIYNLVEFRTGNTELAIDLSSWAENAEMGREYECDELHAEIIDD